MTKSELLLILLAVATGFVGYALGRIDGYWKRAAEDRRRSASIEPEQP